MMLLGLLSILACTGSEYPPDLPLDAAYTDCEGDTDCTIVELGCCDDCNGGLAVAVNNTTSEAEVRDRFSERCGRRTACTEMDCPDHYATCDEGTCTRHQEDDF